MMGLIKQRWFSLAISLTIGCGILLTCVSGVSAQEKSDEINYEAGFYYTVKKGDTLWDLSQRFNDTPWQWPDLWEENKQVPNPHWIYPGERIRLFRKKDQHQYDRPQKEIPPTDANITASAPVVEAPEVFYHYSNIDRIGFIRKPAMAPLGLIYKARDNKTLISKGDLVYIRYSEPENSSEMSPGMRLTVYRTMPPTDDRKSEKKIGTQHYILGIAEVVKTEKEYALTQIIESFRAIHMEDKVMAYLPRDPQIQVVDSSPGIEGKIIISEEHTQLLGELFIAFIDKGSNDNIVPGQIYNVYFQESVKIDSGTKLMQLDKVDTGSILVLQTEETTSTVVVTDSRRQMVPGQSFHTP